MQYQRNDLNSNPFVAWLFNFPSAKIEAIPDEFEEIWNKEIKDRKNNFLCAEYNEICSIVQKSKFSVTELIKIYCFSYNTPSIYECNNAHFLSFDQFPNVFVAHIIDENHREIIFKAMNEVNDGRIALLDLINTLSIVMKRADDKKKMDAINALSSSEQ